MVNQRAGEISFLAGIVLFGERSGLGGRGKVGAGSERKSSDKSFQRMKFGHAEEKERRVYKSFCFCYCKIVLEKKKKK